MSQRFGVSRRLLVGCTLLLTSQALFVSTSTSATSDDNAAACAELARWAEAYEGTTITLDEFARFDRGHRIAIFNAVSPEVRASLMQDQLRRFSQRADLSDTQRALIAEAITIVTPALYRQDAAAKKAKNEFWARAESAFTSAEHRRPWFDVGANVAAIERDASVGAAVAIPVASGLLNCNCNTFDHWCSGACIEGSCTPVATGCGSMADTGCNGRCQ